MKFYSYTNDNDNYTKAVSLENVRTLTITEASGKSAIRFGVRLDYTDGNSETLMWLESAEAKKVYKEILDLLQKGA